MLLSLQVDSFCLVQKFLCPVEHKGLTEEMSEAFVKLAKVFGLQTLVRTILFLEKVDSFIEDLV